MAVPPPRWWSRSFPGEADQLGNLRAWIQGYLPACDPRDCLVAIASELGANALTHTRSGAAGGRFTIDVTWCPEAARVAVGDQGSAEVPEIPANVAAETAESGRGLLVVEALSSAWGMTGNAEARWLWADVDWRLGAAPVPAMPSDNRDAEFELARLSGAYPGILAWYEELPREWCALLAVFTPGDAIGCDGARHAAIG